MIDVIKGKRVVLRRKRLEDAWNDYQWKKDEKLAYLDATVPLLVPFSLYLSSYSDELRYADPFEHRYAIETLDGRHIGNCSCYNVDRIAGEAELGILIGDRSYWDKGYGSDAVTTLVHKIFQERWIKKIYLHTLEDNIRAQKCFGKCGFVARGPVTRGIHRFILMEINRPKDSSASAPLAGNGLGK